jgi:hypothetical protein
VFKNKKEYVFLIGQLQTVDRNVVFLLPTLYIYQGIYQRVEKSIIKKKKEVTKRH